MPRTRRRFRPPPHPGLTSPEIPPQHGLFTRHQHLSAQGFTSPTRRGPAPGPQSAVRPPQRGIANPFPEHLRPRQTIGLPASHDLERSPRNHLRFSFALRCFPCPRSFSGSTAASLLRLAPGIRAAFPIRGQTRLPGTTTVTTTSAFPADSRSSLQLPRQFLRLLPAQIPHRIPIHPAKRSAQLRPQPQWSGLQLAQCRPAGSGLHRLPHSPRTGSLGRGQAQQSRKRLQPVCLLPRLGSDPAQQMVCRLQPGVTILLTNPTRPQRIQPLTVLLQRFRRGHPLKSGQRGLDFRMRQRLLPEAFPGQSPLPRRHRHHPRHQQNRTHQRNQHAPVNLYDRLLPITPFRPGHQPGPRRTQRPAQSQPVLQQHENLALTGKIRTRFPPRPDTRPQQSPQPQQPFPPQIHDSLRPHQQHHHSEAHCRQHYRRTIPPQPPPHVDPPRQTANLTRPRCHRVTGQTCTHPRP